MRAWLRRVLHIHRDPNYYLDNVWYCYQCRCGARRVRLAYANIIGPEPAGWPRAIDRHGAAVNDSGWVAP